MASTLPIARGCKYLVTFRYTPSMSVSQWILLALVAVVTAWEFASMVSIRQYTSTPRGVAIALVLPLAWATLIALPPWGAWLDVLLPLLGPLLGLAFMAIPTAAMLLVATIIMWMQAALSGDWSIILSLMPWRERP